MFWPCGTHGREEKKKYLGFCGGNLKRRMKRLESLGLYEKVKTTVVHEGSLWCRFNYLTLCRIVCLPVRYLRKENEVSVTQSHNCPGCFVWVRNLVSHIE